MVYKRARTEQISSDEDVLTYKRWLSLMRQAQALSSENLKTPASQIRAWINENSTVFLEDFT